MLCRTVALAMLQQAGSPLPDGVLDPRTPMLGGGERRPEALGTVESPRVPVACHWASAEDEDLCDRVLIAAEEAWEAQVEEIGFQAPIPDDDGVLDFYLSSDGTAGGAYTIGPYRDATTGDDMMSCHAYVVIDPGVPDDELELYVVHEFQHVLQYATDFTEPTYMIWESVASAAETWTYPERPLYQSYVVDFQATPWLGILGNGDHLWSEYEIWSYYEYGGSVWSMHLEDGFGDGSGVTGAELWAATAQEGWENEPDVIDAWDFVTGDWEEALLDLSAMRLTLGTSNAPDWAPWTGSQWRVPREGSIDLAVETETSITPEVGPYQTGVIYVQVKSVDAASGGTLSWELESTASARWAVVVVQDAVRIATERGKTGSVALSGSADLTLGIVNLGPEGFDGDDTIRSAPLTVHLSAEEGTGGDGGSDDGGGEDSGSTGDDDGGAGDDGGTTDTGDPQPRPRPPLDDDEEPGGCGCSGLPSPAGLGLLLSLVAAVPALRRRS